MIGYPDWVIATAGIAVYVFLAAFVACLAWVALGLFVKNYSGALMTASYAFFLLFYAIGNALKVAEVGPEFARYHLGDLGFVPVATIFIVTIYELVTQKINFGHLAQPWNYNLIIVRNKRKMKFVFVVFAIMIGYEVFAGLAVKQLGDRPNPGMGGFDWIDILAYAVGSLAFFFLLFGANRLMMKRLEMIRQARRKPRQKVSSVKPSVKYKKSRKPRGVR